MNSVIKGASYVLVHTPDMVLYNGTTQTTERVDNPVRISESSAGTPPVI